MAKWWPIRRKPKPKPPVAKAVETHLEIATAQVSQARLRLDEALRELARAREIRDHD